MSKYIYEPVHATQAVQWKGDNLQDIWEFLTPLTFLRVGDAPTLNVNQDILTVYGYDTINGYDIDIRKNQWLVFTLSTMHDCFMLTTMTDDAFNECFKPYLTAEEKQQHD